MKVRFWMSLSLLALVILSPTLASAFPVSTSSIRAAENGDQRHDTGYRSAKKQCCVDGAWREC
jgi:hypothetical protein